MNMIQTLSSILGVAFVSGVNMYAAVLVIGLGLRFNWLHGLPHELHALANPFVIATAALLYFLEFFADKIPGVSVAWDAIHTFIRPLGGAALALASAADLNPTLQILAFLVGGGVALGAHSTKMSYRLLAHAHPDPVSTSLFSMLEDVGVVGLLALVYTHPRIALVVMLALIAAMIVILPMLLRIMRFLGAGVVGRIASWFPDAGSPPSIPAWVAVQPRPGVSVYPCFARRLKRAPRFKRGYLVFTPEQSCFIYRGWFRTRTAPAVEPAHADFVITNGMIFDVANLGERQSVYFTKKWSRRFQALGARRPSAVMPLPSTHS
jgi:hypothetical protein